MRIISVLLILLLIPGFAFAEGEPDFTGSIFEAITQFFQFIVDLITGVLNILKILTLDLIPALVVMLVSIFAFFGRLIAYVVTFGLIPPVPLEGTIGQGLEYVLQFNVLGFTLIGLVTSILTFAVGFKVAKKLIL